MYKELTEQCERIQDDICDILDGCDDNIVEDLICNVVEERFEILLTAYAQR